VVAVLPAACWFVPAVIRAGPSYARELIGHHMLGRAVDSWQHKQPFYFYANEALWNFLPWIVLAIPAGIRAWRRRRDEPASAMFLLWFALGFAAFSAVSGKRIAYILPLAPALALLVARGVEALLVEREPPERRTAKILTVILCVVCAIGITLALSVFLVVAKLEDPLAPPPSPVPVLVGGLALAGVAFGGLWFGALGRRLAAAFALAAAMAVGFFFHDITLVRRDNAKKSSRPVAERMDALLPPGEGEVGIYPARPPAELGGAQYAYSGAFNVYSARIRFVPLRDEEELREFLASPERRLVLAGETFVDELGELPPEVWDSPAGRTGRNEMRFLTNFLVVGLGGERR
jgi:4-amino-4-deoxy-L-arabinose transferase-like glycosyltransferase